jgi:hypothetical protein
VATTGQIVKKFSLESSNPQSMTAGPDGNLWITEGYTATEPSKIARLDPDTGAVAQFTVSTSNVGLASIRKGYDGALWFTESATNKIGRITTAGRITDIRSRPQPLSPMESSRAPLQSAATVAAFGSQKPLRTNMRATIFPSGAPHVRRLSGPKKWHGRQGGPRRSGGAAFFRLLTANPQRTAVFLIFSQFFRKAGPL